MNLFASPPICKPDHNAAAHDPLFCGLDPMTGCPACQRAHTGAERAELDRLTPPWLRLWRRIRQRFPLIRRGTRDLDEGAIPAALPPADVAGLVFTLCHAEAREPIAAALAAEIFAIARQAVRAELENERNGQ